MFSYFLIAALVVLGKVSGLFRDMYLSYAFGVGWEADAYFLAINVPAVVLLAFYSTISLALLPVYADVKEHESDAQRFEFISNVVNVYFVTAVLIGLLTFRFAGPLISLFSPDLPAAAHDLAVELLKIVSFTFGLSTLCAVLATIQYSHRVRFGLLLSPVVNNLIVLPAVFFLSPRYGIYSAVFAALAGWLIQVPIQYALAAKHFSYRLTFSLRNPHLRRLGWISIPIFIGLLVDQVNLLINLYFAGGLEQGTISAINYATRLAQLPSSVIILIVSMIVYPVIADLVAQKRLGEFEEVVAGTTRLIVMICLPAIVLIYLYRESVVTILFMRGSFDQDAAHSTAALFGIYCLGLLFASLREFFNRVFLSLRLAVAPLLVSGVIVAVNLVVSVALVGRLGAHGLAIGTTVSLMVGVAVQMAMIGTHIRLWSKVADWRFVATLIAANGALILGAVAILGIDQGHVYSLAHIAMVWTAAAIIYGGIVFALQWRFLMPFLSRLGRFG